jgi:hypothetical protein
LGMMCLLCSCQPSQCGSRAVLLNIYSQGSEGTTDDQTSNKHARRRWPSTAAKTRATVTKRWLSETERRVWYCTTQVLLVEIATPRSKAVLSVMPLVDLVSTREKVPQPEGVGLAGAFPFCRRYRGLPQNGDVKISRP